MVKLTKIYTRTGDKGETGLGDGSRTPKHSLRVAAYGTVEEANAALGLVRLYTKDLPIADAMLARIQNDLFDIGADLCTPHQDNSPRAYLRFHEKQVERLEHEIDIMNKDLSTLNSFILPGGSPAAAHCHMARTVARRAERLVTELALKESINPATLKYLNRLSDHLFVLGRHLNDDGARDVLWVPGQNRPGDSSNN